MLYKLWRNEDKRNQTDCKKKSPVQICEKLWEYASCLVDDHFRKDILMSLSRFFHHSLGYIVKRIFFFRKHLIIFSNLLLLWSEDRHFLWFFRFNFHYLLMNNLFLFLFLRLLSLVLPFHCRLYFLNVRWNLLLFLTNFRWWIYFFFKLGGCFN